MTTVRTKREAVARVVDAIGGGGGRGGSVAVGVGALPEIDELTEAVEDGLARLADAAWGIRDAILTLATAVREHGERGNPR
jgi:hypothetical protein